MTTAELKRLKNTIKPIIRDAATSKKKILLLRLKKIKRPLADTLLSDFIKDIVSKALQIVQGGRRDMGYNTRSLFPSKNTLLKYKNLHLANEVMQKVAWNLLGKISEAAKHFEEVYTDPNYVLSFFLDNDILGIIDKYSNYSHYVSRERTNFIRGISRIKQDLSDVIKSILTFVLRYTMYSPSLITLRDLIHADANVALFRKLQINNYNIPLKLKQISDSIYQYVDIDILELLLDKLVDYTPVVFTGHLTDSYPLGFVKYYSKDPDRLRDLVLRYISKGDPMNLTSLSLMFGDFWYLLNSWKQDLVGDLVYDLLTGKGIQLADLLKNILKRVYKEMGITGERKNEKLYEENVLANIAEEE